MSLSISVEELVKDWSLSFSDLDFVSTKPVVGRLNIAVQLKFFEARGYFAETVAAIPQDAVKYLAEQLGVGEHDLSEPNLSTRSSRRHVTEILEYLGTRRMVREDRDGLISFISTELCHDGMSADVMLERVFLWCRERKVYEPSRLELERLVRSERRRFLDSFLDDVTARLPPEAVMMMRHSLDNADGPTGFNTMSAGAGQVSLDNFLAVTERLAFIQSLKLPRDILLVPGKSWIAQIMRRVGGETASEMRRHTPALQMGLYVVFLMAKEAQIIDTVIDLLVETVHKITTRSKRKVITGIARDIEKVSGKERLLVDIAAAAIGEPSGLVCDVIFPVADKDKLAAIIKEYKAKGALDRRIYAVMRRSYASHYRRMLPRLLSVLEFRSNNSAWRPVLDALEWIKAMLDDGSRFVPSHSVPIEGVIPAKWRRTGQG